MSEEHESASSTPQHQQSASEIERDIEAVEEPIVGLTRAMVWLTAVLAAATVAGAVISYYQWKAIRDSAPDTHKLVQANARLAQAASDQARLTAQLVDAAKISARAAQDAAKAGQEQAKSSVGVMSAELQSAQAQTKATTLAIAQQKPLVTLVALTLTGFNSNPNPDGTIPINVQYSFRNQGTVAFTSKGVTPVLESGKELPVVVPKPATVPPQGNDVLVASGTSISTWKPITFNMAKPLIDIAKSHGYMFFIGNLVIEDLNGVDHTYYFAYKVLIENGQASQFLEAGGPIYHRET